MAQSLARKRAEEEDDSQIAIMGRCWITRFLNRHPALAARYGGQLDQQRAHASNPSIIRDFFRKLDRILQKNKIQPQDIYNMDEKGFILGFSARSRVICRSYRRNPLVTQDGSWELLTALECVSSDFFVLPPFVVSKAKSHHAGWHGKTDDLHAKFCLSPNGWTDDSLGLQWLIDHFDFFTKERIGGRPRLLIIDGHASHVSYKFCKYAVENNIHLISLPPHSLHLLQPLDVGLFGSLQHFYGKAADNYIRNSHCGILKGTFWGFYRAARKQAYTKLNIKNAFRATGIYPFNPNAVLTRFPSIKSPSSLSFLDDKSTSLATDPILRTPKTRRDLRYQTTAAIKLVSSKVPSTKADTISFILRLSHLAEASYSRAEIESIEAQKLREAFAGKKAAKTDRRVLSKARIITGADVVRLKKEQDDREALALQRKQARAHKATTTGNPEAES